MVWSNDYVTLFQSAIHCTQMTQEKKIIFRKKWKLQRTSLSVVNRGPQIWYGLNDNHNVKISLLQEKSKEIFPIKVQWLVIRVYYIRTTNTKLNTHFLGFWCHPYYCSNLMRSQGYLWILKSPFFLNSNFFWNYVVLYCLQFVCWCCWLLVFFSLYVI